MLLSSGVGYLYLDRPGESEALVRFLISAGIVGGLAVILYIIRRKGDMAKLFRKEALCVIGIGWLLATGVGALPYLLILDECTLVDALFESASGFTTTGSTIISSIETLPRSLLFWRCMTQWIGGLGIVVFFVVILSSLGAGSKILFSSESSGQSIEIDYGRIQSGALMIIFLYVGLTFVGAVVLQSLGMSGYEAVCHIFTTLSTGGFSTRSGSIAAFETPFIEWTLIGFMLIGGTSFLLMIRVARKNWKDVRNNTETYVYYALVLIGTLCIVIALYPHPSSPHLPDTLRIAAFQVVSLMTTTGYTTSDYNSWPLITHILLMGFMIIGGSSGSTAGGLKVVRLIITSYLCILTIERTFRTQVVRSININGRNLPEQARESVMIYLVLVAIMTFISIFLIAILEPQMSFEGIISTVLAHLFNVGPGFQEAGPTHNYTFLHNPTKLFLTLLMIMGRLELYAILVFFAPSFWKRFS